MKERVMQTMSAYMFENKYFLKKLKRVFPIVIGLTLVFAAPCWCQTLGNTNNQEMRRERKTTHMNRRKAHKNKSNKSEARQKPTYENNQRLRKKAQEFEKLTPQKQDELRHRMDRFKSLSLEDRTLYEKRFEQLQQLPPDQRKDIQNKLRKIDRLSPEEKEEIRKKFKSSTH